MPVYAPVVCVLSPKGSESLDEIERSLTKLARKVTLCHQIGELRERLAIGRMHPAEVLLADTAADFDLRALLDKAYPVPVIVIASSSTASEIVAAIQMGAADYLLRPIRVGALAAALDLARKQEPSDDQDVDEHDPLTEAAVFASPVMREIQDIARRVSESDATVLIRGESGTGKEILARFIHRHSRRAEAPFIRVNCAAVPDTLVESELFGYEQGAFTGASRAKPGLFEAARHGTIFLDEISDTSIRVQAKLLHVLQDKRFHRLGGRAAIATDARILAASNRDLEQALGQGAFREDLYFRLKVVDIYLPPLRERRDEIELFIDRFAERFSMQYEKPLPRIDPPLRQLLTHYEWPGNIRELENTIKRLVLMGDPSAVREDLLNKSALNREMSIDPDNRSEQENVASWVGSLSLKEVARQARVKAQKRAILDALERTQWNRKVAAKMLGVSYKTILDKMKDCGITTRA